LTYETVIPILHSVQRKFLSNKKGITKAIKKSQLYSSMRNLTESIGRWVLLSAEENDLGSTRRGYTFKCGDHVNGLRPNFLRVEIEIEKMKK